MILAKASKVGLSRVKVITEKIEFILYCQEQHLFKELGDVSNKRQPLDVVRKTLRKQQLILNVACGGVLLSTKCCCSGKNRSALSCSEQHAASIETTPKIIPPDSLLLKESQTDL